MSSSVANNGTTEPEPKRRRLLLDAGGPIEDDETARQKMRDARVYEIGADRNLFEWDGFDPDNVGDAKCLNCDNVAAGDVKPMGYFAMNGDLPMMRWLYVNGADTRDVGTYIASPMYKAADFGRIEVCKWLFAHGAAKDIKRRTLKHTFPPNGRSPLFTAFRDSSIPVCRDTSRWLILKGALCKDDDSGDLDIAIMKQDIGTNGLRREERKALLEWADNLHRPRTSFLLFFSGALSIPQHAYRTRRNVSPLQRLGGKPGIMELIGDYVGFVRGREARIIRQLTEMMPDLIQ